MTGPGAPGVDDEAGGGHFRSSKIEVRRSGMRLQRLVFSVKRSAFSAPPVRRNAVADCQRVEVEHALEAAVRDRQLAGSLRGVEVRALEQLPFRVVEHRAVHHWRRTVGDDDVLPAQRAHFHGRCGLQGELERERVDRRLERREILELGHARRLHDGAVLQVRTHEQLVAAVDPLIRVALAGRGFHLFVEQQRLPRKTRQRPVSEVGIAALREDPAGLALRHVGEVLGEKPVDAGKTRAGRDVVQRDHGVEVLEHLLVGRAAQQLVRGIVGGFSSLATPVTIGSG